MNFIFRLFPLLTLALLLTTSFSLKKIQNRSIANAPTNNTNCSSNIKKIFSPLIWTENRKNIAFNIILSGSNKLSRTVALGKQHIAALRVSTENIPIVANHNFNTAVMYVMDNLNLLKVNKDTAIKLNRILTEHLVPESDRGNYQFRLNSTYLNKTDSFVQKNPDSFYEWLESSIAQQLFQRDPVKFAKVIHHNISALDSFPDGNGRLARLLSDLALMKSNRAPALYTDMQSYFATGTARSLVSRTAKVEYYRMVARRGQDIINAQPVTTKR